VIVYAFLNVPVPLTRSTPLALKRKCHTRGRRMQGVHLAFIPYCRAGASAPRSASDAEMKATYISLLSGEHRQDVTFQVSDRYRLASFALSDRGTGIKWLRRLRGPAGSDGGAEAFGHPGRWRHRV
jgi:hypothetical protein